MPAKAKNLHATKVRKAVTACDNALDTFEQSKRVLAMVVYESGNRTLDSFVPAIRAVLEEHSDRVRLSERAARSLFNEIEHWLRQSE